MVKVWDVLELQVLENQSTEVMIIPAHLVRFLGNLFGAERGGSFADAHNAIEHAKTELDSFAQGDPQSELFNILQICYAAAKLKEYELGKK